MSRLFLEPGPQDVEQERVEQSGDDGVRAGTALAELSAVEFMIILDTSIVGVALPSIQRGLGFSQAGLAWVVNAYVIAFGGLLLLSGRLGDLVGRKRVFVAGLLVFTAASLLSGAAVSQPMLVAARFAQGIGGAMAAAVVLGISITIFPESDEQAKALGIVGFVTAAGGTVGGVAGGYHLAFGISAAIAGTGILLAATALRRPAPPIANTGGPHDELASTQTEGEA